MSRRRFLAASGLLSLGAIAGGAIERFVGRWREPSHVVPASGIHLKPGPWGECYVIPFYISAPDRALPIDAMVARGTRWVFSRQSDEDVRAFFERNGVSAEDRDSLITTETMRTGAEGPEVWPTLAALRTLPKVARTRLYLALAAMPENRAEITFIHKEAVEEHFEGSGVAAETLALFQDLCGEAGEYVVFCGLGVMLAALAEREEQVRFLKALTRQKTMLLRLYVGSETNFRTLADYWGKGPHEASVRTLLQSLAEMKEGTWIGLANVLPPLPAAQLYEYPTPDDGGAPASSTPYDCHWTSFNFFRKTPDSDSLQPGHMMQVLQRDYYKVQDEPRYGDVVMLTKPDGTAVHSAVMLADDVVFTKNGATVAFPWMLSTVGDLLKRYSFEAPADQGLTVSYFRSLAV